MKNWKKYASLLLALVLCLSLAACGSSGRKWSDTDVIDGYGTVTRNGKQIDVCVCHDQEAVYLYSDDEKHELFDTAKLPTDEIYDYDKDWDLGRISFSDFTGDDNSDLQVYLSHSDMSESYIVWAWEESEGYVYQPNDSWFYHSIVVRDPPTDDEFSEFGIYEGLWLSDEDNQYDGMYIEFDREGNWQLYSGGDVIDQGYLYILEGDVLEGDGTYICSYQGGAIEGGYVEVEGDRLYIDTVGYFDYLDGRDGQWQGAGGGNWDNEYRVDSEVYHRDISEFEGAWYYDNDLSATTYIIIDNDGNWSYCQRTPGDAEGTVINRGIFTYSPDESGTYYAESILYDDVSYQVFDLDEGVLLWDGDTYYWME